MRGSLFIAQQKHCNFQAQVESCCNFDNRYIFNISEFKPLRLVPTTVSQARALLQLKEPDRSRHPLINIAICGVRGEVSALF